MPEAAHNCSIALFHRNILICGYQHSCIYRYEIANKYYNTLNLKIAPNTQKALFVGKEKAYLIENSGSIYESDHKDTRNWNAISKSYMPAVNIISHKVLYGDSMFFFISDNPIQSLFEFDLNGKQLIDHGRISIK